MPLARLPPFTGGTSPGNLPALAAHSIHTRRFVRFSRPQLTHVFMGLLWFQLLSVHPFQKRFARCVTEKYG